MFFLDMRSPGVDIRPIKQANGQSEFNEVYFDDVRIPDSQRLGEVGDGWRASLTTLMNERLAIGGGIATGYPDLEELVRALPLGDGVALDGWMMKPPDFDASKKYPLLMYVYGEPAAHRRPHCPALSGGLTGTGRGVAGPAPGGGVAGGV